MKILLILRRIINYFAPGTFLKIVAIFLLIVPVILIIYYLVLLPVTRFPDSILEDGNAGSLPALSVKDSLNPDLETLLREWQDLHVQYQSVNALLALARHDSIYLSLNLKDSTLSLYIKGVNIRRAKISELEISRNIRLLKNKGKFTLWAGKPFTLENDWASVEKSPIKVKEAPKDTIEAMKNMVEPAPAPIQDVHLSLKFDRQLILHISQVQRTRWKNYGKRLRYDWDWLKVRIDETLQLLKSGREAKSPMWIDIEIDRSDALAFYRAIPERANLVITY